MPPPQILIGVVGKTNVGKSTFFAAATLLPVKIENRPFVTIEPNVGIAYVRRECAHVDLGLPSCNPKNSVCLRGNRFIPVKLMDVAGLIKDAHKGRGLGNKFMDDLRQADVLLHVVDLAGSTDEEGRPVPPGTYDPLDEVISIEREINEWFYSVVSKDWERFARGLDSLTWDGVVDALAKRVSGLSIRREHVILALKASKLELSKPSSWREEELRNFIVKLREIAKPILVVGNKADIPEAEDNYRRLTKELKVKVIPTSAAYELALRKAEKSGLITYLPGDNDFQIVDESKLNPKQKTALETIRGFMKKYGNTGVQQALNTAVFEVLNMIVVYPVEDQHKYTDSNGNVLPDAYIVKKGTTAQELAYMIHTDLGKAFLYAILAKENKRVGATYELKDNDIVKVVSAK
ncbi:MAG: redox-regulated ATPase YchF [Zestosphaera tikiterensis]|uniref:Redox-regulated ATPase YchF n=1 Tax=Zestosphaera tikiterensis TaxID=1973259 RepID=A0A2R7Y7V8_9CREN|nr:MAG: redox-regulated ATPase YchF [Zestosphaera tikiterensis]